MNQSFLLTLGALLVVSIAADRWVTRIGIPGSLAIFLLGLLLPVGSFPRLAAAAGLFQIDSYTSCLLLFAAGFQLSRRILRSGPLLRAALLLAGPGTLITIGFSALVIRGALHGLMALQRLPPMTSLGIDILAVALAVCLAPTDWSFSSFMIRRMAHIEEDLLRIFDLEAAVGSAITLMVGAAAIDAIKHLGQPDIAGTLAGESFSFLAGLVAAVVSGVVMAVLLTLSLLGFARHRSQHIMVVLGFIFLGFGSQTPFGHGGLICALVMGMVSSFLLDRRGLATEKQLLEGEIETINLVAESAIFFFAGVALRFDHLSLVLPLGLLLILTVVVMRLLLVGLFLPGSGLSRQQRLFLTCWNPKGAISIGLAAAAPALVDAGTRPDTPMLDRFLDHGLMLEVVVLVVLVWMVGQILLVPRLDRRLL